MRQLFAFCLIFGTCIAPAWGDEKPSAISSGDDKQELEKTLDEFIERAIVEGLLDAPGHGSANIDPHITGPEKEVFPKKGCEPVRSADFSEYEELREFSDLYLDETAENSPENSAAIQKRLSLGLYSEARALLNQAGLESSYQSHIANLLENHRPVDSGFFAELSGCGSLGSFWYAVALLADHDTDGIERLHDTVPVYRSLPFQMQIDVAKIAIPALDSHGELLLARKLMSSFTLDDIANSSSLQFNVALLDEDAGAKIDDFIIRPEFRADALDALLRKGGKLTTAQRELLLEEVSKIIENDADERQLIVALKFALKEFGKRSNITEMMELAKLPSLQSPVARNTILQSVAAVIEHDLKSDNQLVVLSTFQAMIDHSGLLDSQPVTARLYPAAAERADEMGYVSLAARLADEKLRRTERLMQQAEVAFRKGDYGKVYEIAGEHSGQLELSLIAAKAALAAGDADGLKAFEASLVSRPDLALSLIKEDATSGKWLVSEQTYLAAGSDPDIAKAAQAANILALRGQALSAGQRPNVQLNEVDEILTRSTKDLSPSVKEVN